MPENNVSFDNYEWILSFFIHLFSSFAWCFTLIYMYVKTILLASSNAWVCNTLKFCSALVSLGFKYKLALDEYSFTIQLQHMTEPTTQWTTLWSRAWVETSKPRTRTRPRRLQAESIPFISGLCTVCTFLDYNRSYCYKIY